MIKLKRALIVLCDLSSQIDWKSFRTRSIKKLLVMDVATARAKLYKEECKEVGKELMISGMKLKYPQGEWWNENRFPRLFNLFSL